MKQLRVEEIPYKYEIGEIVKGIKILTQGYTIRKDNCQKIKSYTALNLEHNIEIDIREDVLKAPRPPSQETITPTAIATSDFQFRNE